MTLHEAIESLLNRHHLGDFCYQVRERVEDIPEGTSSWDHPDVVDFGACVERLRVALTNDEIKATGAEALAMIEDERSDDPDDEAFVAEMTADGRDPIAELLSNDEPAIPNLPPTTVTIVGSLETPTGHVVLTEIRYWDEATKRYGEWVECMDITSKRRCQVRITSARGYQGQEGDQ